MKAQHSPSKPDAVGSGLLNDAALLAALFPDESSRPGVRWLRRMRQLRRIPFYRIGGRMVLFDAGEVREALERQFKVNVGVQP
jgi:hypothetical protein